MSCKELNPEFIVQGALGLLGRPAKLINRQGDLYDILQIVLERYRNRLQIHDGDFLLKMRRVTLPAMRLDVSFNEPSWGRPVMCDLDPSTLSSDMALPRRDVELIAIRDQDQFRNNVSVIEGGAGLSGNDGTVIDYAHAVSWFRDGTTVKLFFEFGGRFPTTDATYRFFYQPGGLSEVFAGQEITWLREFAGMLQVDCALAFLPLSEIPDPQYTRLENRWEKDLMKREPILDLFLQQDSTEQSGYVGGYNRSRIGGHRRLR